MPVAGTVERVRRTFRLECVRSLFAGVIESVVATFALVVAVRYFGASSASKAWLVAGPNIGLMAGPAVVAWFHRTGLAPARAASIVHAIAALFFVLAALVDEEVRYIGFVACAGAAVAASVPLMTQVYQDAYPEADRGRLFSRAFFLRIAASVGAGALIGWFLDWRPGGHPWVLGCAACSCGMSSVLVGSFPESASSGSKVQGSAASRGRMLDGLRYVRTDAIFRRTLISWMFLGIGNLVMLPLRVELLARPDGEGWVRGAAEIALLTAVIPNVARLSTTLWWGRMFDRWNFFVLRAVLNFLFAGAILAFFLGDRMWVLVVGGVLYGLANSGGDVVWSLWVTKVTVPERVADYMAVHTFFTGIRGVLAPVIAYAAMERFPLSWTAWGCAAAIIFANVILLPEIFHRRGSGLGSLSER